VGNGIGRTVGPVELPEGVQLNCTAKDFTVERQGLTSSAWEKDVGRIDIHATARELERAPSVRRMPLIVVTAGILQDRWLKTVPELEAKAQTRLAALSANSIHVLDRGTGHLIPSQDPRIVIAAAQAVLAAAASGQTLAPCSQAFRPVPAAQCLRRGQLGRQRT
jgi:hypothetical protein